VFESKSFHQGARHYRKRRRRQPRSQETGNLELSRKLTHRHKGIASRLPVTRPESRKIGFFGALRVPVQVIGIFSFSGRTTAIG
jgi:hypothetical protein